MNAEKIQILLEDIALVVEDPELSLFLKPTSVDALERIKKVLNEEKNRIKDAKPVGYKVRNKDGLYRGRGSNGYTKKGKLWPSKGALKSHLRLTTRHAQLILSDEGDWVSELEMKNRGQSLYQKGVMRERREFRHILMEEYFTTVEPDLVVLEIYTDSSAKEIPILEFIEKKGK